MVDRRTPIQLTGGDPGTPKEAAYRILFILGCTDESGAIFGDDLETITTIITDLVAAYPNKDNATP